MAGAQSSVERKRGEGVRSELGVQGGRKAEGMPEDQGGSVPQGWGGFVQDLATGSINSLVWVTW